MPRCGLRWSSSQQHIYSLRAISPTRTKSTFCRQSSMRLHSAHTGSILPTKLWGKSLCEVAESVYRRPQITSSWTGSESECRDAVCVGVLRNSIFIQPERSLESVNCTGFEDTLNILAALVLRCTPSAEKYVHMVSSIESRLGPSTQDKAQRLMATTGHFCEHAMTAYLPPGIAGERRIFADRLSLIPVCSRRCPRIGRNTAGSIFDSFFKRLGSPAPLKWAFRQLWRKYDVNLNGV